MNTPLPRDLEPLLRADGEGPAVRIGGEAASALIDGALQRFEREGGVLQGRSSKKAPKLRLGWMLAAALALTGSAAAMVLQPWAAASPEPAPDARPQAGPAAQRALAGAQARDVTPQANQEPADAVPAPAPRPAERAGAAEPPARRVRDLLRAANQLRGDGQYEAAERKYLQVVARSPRSAAGYTARVAAASLRNERLGDAKGALQLYRDALRSDSRGALTPEIHQGMADAHRRLGQPAAERRALQALLAEEREGPAAERARARLRALDPALDQALDQER